MIIIGLSGGKPRDRKEIGARLKQFGSSRLQVLEGSTSRHDSARIRDLTVALRDSRLNKSLGGLVFANVMTQGEADEIRRYGGVIWHVQGAPSETVRIELGDPLVTAMQGGCRHFLDAIDAFSDHVMKTQAAY